MQNLRSQNSTALARYFADIRTTTRLTKDEERQLARRIQRGDERAMEELITANLSFVVKVASEYRNLGIPFEDLLNEGNIGLIEAAKRFDASKDTKFISYAVWWIRKSILKALADHSNLVRVPTHQMKKIREVREAEARLRRKLGRKPRREEISAFLDRDVSQIDETLQVSLHGVSLDEKVGRNEDRPLWEFLEDANVGSVVEGLIQRQATFDLGGAMETLGEQEVFVIRRRFGLQGEKALTLQQVGEQMGVSRERVRQIENKAKAKLRRFFTKRNACRMRSRLRDAHGPGPSPASGTAAG